jgi:hypothetical protein
LASSCRAGLWKTVYVTSSGYAAKPFLVTISVVFQCWLGFVTDTNPSLKQPHLRLL